MSGEEKEMEVDDTPVSNKEGRPQGEERTGSGSKDVAMDQSNVHSGGDHGAPVENKVAKKSPKKSKGEQKNSVKKVKKGIFISYSPDGGFLERLFVCTAVRQFKENNLDEDIWFDKDEHNTDSPAWFAHRMEAVEKCRAAVCFLTECYFQCPVSIYELRCLLERQNSSNPPKVFAVLCESVDIPKQYNSLLRDVVNLSNHNNTSIAEKASRVIGSLMLKLEPYISINAPYAPVINTEEFTKEYKDKKLCRWSRNDLQSWLHDLGIKEFYCQSFAEMDIDGFLLMSLMDQDMQERLGVDSRVVRRKILQHIVAILEKEHKLADNWHLRARTQRPKTDTIYIIYDPADVKLAHNLKQDLKRKGLTVTSHEKLGSSRDEFLQINGPSLAAAKHILVIMTDASSVSPFVFHEVLFADWLGKNLVTAMFKNSWEKLRPSLKAVLGECSAIDFETKMYTEAMDVLEHQIKPLKRVPGVVLEQSYLNRMMDGLKPLQVLGTTSHASWSANSNIVEPRVFISYQWDAHNKVQDIKRLLESNGIPCWAESIPTMSQDSRGSSGGSHRTVGSGQQSSGSQNPASAHETAQDHIHRNMRSSAIIVSCVTSRYLQSDNCVKDLILADSLRRLIIPVMLRFVPWPPDCGMSAVKKILARTSPVDFSNEKLYKQNFHLLLERVRKHLQNLRM
ncbi:uncharacterized protein LOC121430660 [Lytechinus variegatus]|uniref:uncharacterized protein LOC121430660 n=1 Tax=Lytechinus variegatus TaxID=7654 RepID=UPI001BB23BCB|nr:uncharacterized protein LOC121430660 [Lytechinus variegatus]